MSKVIKASRITGEYKLNDIEIIENNSNISAVKEESESTDSDNQEEIMSSEKHKRKLKKADKKAEAIIEKAEKQAEVIINEAKNKSEKIENEAYNKAYKKGLQEGEKKGYENKITQLTETINNLNVVKAELKKEIHQERQKLPEKVINLAVMIAQKIVSVKLELEPELINNIVKDMLENIINDFNEIKIKVVPELIKNLNKEELEKIKYDSQIEFIPDSNLNKGDCIIETDYGGKDGTVENKLKLITKKLLKE